MTSPTSPERPFSDLYLFEYSAEHVYYEFVMLVWLARALGKRDIGIFAVGAANATRLNNALIESFVVHLRNVIDFLYFGPQEPTDVVASDFFADRKWKGLRPKLSPTLQAARTRAHKEIAHLTTDRLPAGSSAKAWKFLGLLSELESVMQLFISRALPSRCSPRMSTVFDETQPLTPTG